MDGQWASTPPPPPPSQKPEEEEEGGVVPHRFSSPLPRDQPQSTLPFPSSFFFLFVVSMKVVEGEEEGVEGEEEAFFGCYYLFDTGPSRPRTRLCPHPFPRPPRLPLFLSVARVTTLEAKKSWTD